MNIFLKQNRSFITTILLIVLLFFISINLNAQNERKLTFVTEYGYNNTWEHFGGFYAIGSYPIKDYFNAELGVKAYTSNVYAVAGKVKTLFPKKYGEWRLENRLLYRAFVRNHTFELSGGLVFGFRRDHINLGIGFFARLVSKMGTPVITNQQRYIIEPFNLLYFLEINVMKNSSLWNIGIWSSNYDNFQMERFHQPIFALIGKYSLKEKPIKFFAEVALKPSGIFFITTNFYEFSSKIGISYLF